MRTFAYLKPSSVSEALSLLERRGNRARLMAGGTDVLWGHGHQQEPIPDSLRGRGKWAGFPSVAALDSNFVHTLTAVRILE